MKKVLFKNVTAIKKIFAISIVIFSIFQPLQAGERFDIYINVEGCSGSVDMGESQNCDQAQCDGVKSCICLSRHDKITWHMDSGQKFRLEFQGESPLKSNCGRNFHKNQHNCVVQDAVSAGEAFDYDIIVENCPEPIDPRIVIRQ